ncbi:MAG: hypothetical protein JRI68_21590 [Deltaproteobacteria bacterium]|nr:hypothetical protein [Deltaproteobacteria bacterium]
MRSRRGTRRWLVAINLALLAAALPAVGHTDDTDRRAGRHAAKPRPKHRKADNVKASPSSSGSSNSSASDDDDDDNGAGQILGACCVGFVGAMADAAANDASDVEDDYREPDRSGPPPAAWTPAEESESLGSFDAKAAKRALRQASQEVEEQCAPEPGQLAERKVMVSFDPSGQALAVALDPPLEEGDLADCTQQTFLGAQVPPFAGEPTVVAMTLEGTAPAED